MRATTVRFPDALWDLLETEADEDGVSAAQFVRDATVMRIAYSMGRRGDPRLGAALAAVRSTARVLEPAPPARALPAAVADRQRLAALQATNLLDLPPEPGFERLTRLAAELLNAPVALISLVDADRQFFLSCRGLSEPWASQRETPLSHSFCQHVVAAGEVLAVDDAREHPVLRDNLAIRDLGVVAYLGAPIFDDAGHALGTLCVIDSRPRHWSSHQAGLLEDLAGTARSEIVRHAA